MVGESCSRRSFRVVKVGMERERSVEWGAAAAARRKFVSVVKAELERENSEERESLSIFH